MGYDWIVYLIIVIVVAAASYALAPKPQTQPPAGIEEFNVPTAEVGREIPVVFGTKDLRSPNVVWYGDLRTEKVTSGGGKK